MTAPTEGAWYGLGLVGIGVVMGGAYVVGRTGEAGPLVWIGLGALAAWLALSDDLYDREHSTDEQSLDADAE